MADPLVISIILNSNRREDTLACLGSLAQQSYCNHRPIVLDNHSTDDSVEAIQAEFPEVEIISITENRGYAGNNNIGIQMALDQGADWIFVLNEDTILDPACLTNLVDTGESDPQIGIVGPMVYHNDEPTVIQSAGGMLGPKWESIHLAKDEADKGQYQEPHAVEWISGCAILVRANAIRQAGMLDQDYFIYWEETEWCIRIGRAGWKIMHVPQAKIWHKGVQRDYQPKPYVTYYSTRNHLYTLAKHKAPLTAWISYWYQIFRTLLSWSIKPKWREKRGHRNAMWKGMLDFLLCRRGQMS